MFRSKTIFVLGAGASAEVGLPVGRALLENISELINIRYDRSGMRNGDKGISDALKLILDEGREVKKYNTHLHAAWQIISSAEQALSIDNIVDGLEDPHVELVAKLGIVRAIQKAESDSAFFKPIDNDYSRLDFGKFKNTWYDLLTKLFCENRRKSDLEKVFENFSIISFNYDRCIESYLPRSIANYYGIPVEELLPAFKSVPIHRPYGIAGEITWKNNGIPHGFGDVSANYLAESAKKIRTFTEGVEDPSSLSGMRAEIAAADKIVFLGSAFHRQNLEILRTSVKLSTQIFATASSISDPDLEVIEQEIHHVFSMKKDRRKRVVFAKMHCKEFFETHWRTLTA